MAGQLDLIMAAVTPFTDSGDLDLPAARRLYELAAATTGSVLVAGTTGEFPALDDGERLALFEAALDRAGPGHVIAHVGAADSRHARRLAASAVSAGATRLAAITPYYLPASTGEIIAYYSEIAAAVPGAELYAYVYPERTGVDVTPQQLADVAAAAGLAGAKLSGTAGARVREYVRALPAGFRAYTGADGHVALAAEAGATGVISGVSTAFPEVFVRLVGALAAGDAEQAAAAQADVERIVAAGRDIGHFKHALALRGVTGPAGRMTVGTVDAADAAAVADLVRDLVPAGSLHAGAPTG
jgi:4-hydroxy-tetrahydrodipicolinate synthase